MMRPLSCFTIFWFVFGSVIVLLDASFIFLRPSSLSSKTFPYSLWSQSYIKYDRRYADVNDLFVLLISYFNLAEVIIQVVAVILSALSNYVVPQTKRVASWHKGKQTKLRFAAHFLAIIVSSVTLAKTIMYLAMEALEGNKYTKHNTPKDNFMMVVGPTSLWILSSIAILLTSGFAIAESVSDSTRKNKLN